MTIHSGLHDAINCDVEKAGRAETVFPYQNLPVDSGVYVV